MIDLNIKYGLPFCTIKLIYGNKPLILKNVLIDTGSGGSVFKIDKVDEIGITIESDDIIEMISGVGGAEFVYKKNIDSIELGHLRIQDFTIEVGVMDYGFELDGILGMNFLKEVKAIIDFRNMIIRA